MMPWNAHNVFYGVLITSISEHFTEKNCLGTDADKNDWLLLWMLISFMIHNAYNVEDTAVQSVFNWCTFIPKVTVQTAKHISS